MAIEAACARMDEQSARVPPCPRPEDPSHQSDRRHEPGPIGRQRAADRRSRSNDPSPWSSILQTKPLLNDAVLIVQSAEASAPGYSAPGAFCKPLTSQ